jgi:hypothetical protein
MSDCSNEETKELPLGVAIFLWGLCLLFILPFFWMLCAESCRCRRVRRRCRDLSCLRRNRIRPADDPVRFHHPVFQGHVTDFAYATLVSNRVLGGDNDDGAFVTREVILTPGKLGIQLSGHRIASAGPGSPLRGIVSPGDFVLSVNDVVSLNRCIYGLLTNNTNQPRKIQFISNRNATLVSERVIREDQDGAFVTCEVIVTPGRLGIELGGLKITSVSPDSPLQNIVSPGDFVLAVNDKLSLDQSNIDRVLTEAMDQQTKIHFICAGSNRRRSTSTYALLVSDRVIREDADDGEFVTREVVLTPGSIGISCVGLEISHVSRQSPLQGLVSPGDFVHPNSQRLLAETVTQQRKIRFICVGGGMGIPAEQSVTDATSCSSETATSTDQTTIGYASCPDFHPDGGGDNSSSDRHCADV